MAWRASEESAVDVAGTVTAPFRRFGDCHQRCHASRARFAAMTKCDLAKYDQWSQCPFGKIVRGRHTAVIQKHEPVVLMLPYAIL